jgi:glycosyltransferase involved in cell wall biosynthesis
MTAPIVFIDDAHTFGGAQIALAWAIRAIMRNADQKVVCICTARTKEAIIRIIGDEESVTFVVCKPALPLSLASFPVHLVPFFKLLVLLKRQGVGAWWLNLSGLESCLAPLIVLKMLGASHTSWLHCTEARSILFPGRTPFRRVLNRLRDLLADRLLFRLHPVLATPSKAASDILRKRTRTNLEILHLYPTVGLLEGSGPKALGTSPEQALDRINLWMIGRIQFGQKNNRAAVDTLRDLKNRGISACLNIIGDGPDKEELLAGCGDLISAGEINFLGWSADPWSAVTAEDLVLIPSLWEGMPLIAIEAMLRGIRIVTTPLMMFYEGIPSEFIAEGFSAKLLADQVERVLAMSPTDVLEKYATSVGHFSDCYFMESFSTILQRPTFEKGQPHTSVSEA